MQWMQLVTGVTLQVPELISELQHTEPEITPVNMLV